MTPQLQLSILFAFLAFSCGQSLAAEPKLLLEEPFTDPLSEDWFWGLGTWTAKDGVLRGFESGPRRHGPAKVRRVLLKDAAIEVEFRLERAARMIGIGFNRPQGHGHLVAFVVTPDIIRIIGHPKEGETVDYVRKENAKGLPTDVWHKVRLEFKGETLTVKLGDETFTATHPSIAEEKHTLSLGGDSGGPEGEKAGAIEFRKLRITRP
jgi:hypothetical protein